MSNITHELGHALLRHPRGIRAASARHPPTPAMDDRACCLWDQDHEDRAEFLSGVPLIPDEAALRLARTRVSVDQAAAPARAFLTMLHERQGERPADWIEAAERSGPEPLRRFAQGLQTDFSAVLAGLSLPISNGQREGQINRLKTIKRQMFGRANFDLLRRRVLYTA